MTTREPVLVTGAAGFIGFHTARRLLEAGCRVIGVDNLNAYYDPRLKAARLRQLEPFTDFEFLRLDLSERDATAKLFAAHRFAHVVHLAAQAGVRHSLVDPHAYVDANVTGFLNVLEGCRHNGCRHLIYASSSSVYGAVTRMPFSTCEHTDHPLSLYGATKKANEMMAHAYAHLFAIPTTGLRFFTVYGPWGRPDMAMWLFAAAILDGEPIKLFNGGDMRRDFTYVDDVAEAIARLIERPPRGDPHWSGDLPNPAASAAPFRIYNVGNHSPTDLGEVVRLVETELGLEAVRQLAPMQPGDVRSTFADVSDLMREVGFEPKTPIDVGIHRFIEWYRAYRTGTYD